MLKGTVKEKYFTLRLKSAAHSDVIFGIHLSVGDIDGAFDEHLSVSFDRSPYRMKPLNSAHYHLRMVPLDSG